MKTTTAIRLASRAALRRRYGYAALRFLRKRAARAFELHQLRSVACDAVYAGESERAIRAAYAEALRRLQRRWPALRLDDPRSQP